MTTPPPSASAHRVYTLVSFLLLCTQVKEGQYPPPPLAAQGDRRACAPIEYIRRFFRECFSHAFYWKYYLCILCFNVGFVPFSTFLIFYGKDIKLDLGRYGNIMAMQNAMQMAIYLCFGPIVRSNPSRAGGTHRICLSGNRRICGFGFIHSATSFTVWVMAIYAAYAIYQGATTSLGPRLLPSTHYGQFTPPRPSSSTSAKCCWLPSSESSPTTTATP